MNNLPLGWITTDAGTITEVQGGIQKQPKRRPTINHYPFLRVANVLRGHLDLRDIHEIELFNAELEKFRLHDGDLLVVEGNGSPDQIGRAARWQGDIKDCVHQNHLIRMRPTAAVDSKYLTYYWNSPRNIQYLRSIASSTSGLYVLTAAKVRAVEVPLPPLAEQRRIVAAIEEQFSCVDSGVAAIDRALTNLKRLFLTLSAVTEGRDSEHDWRMVTVGDVATVDSGPAFSSAMFRGPGEGIRLVRGDNIEPGALRWTNTRTWPVDKVGGYEHLYIDSDDLILAMDRPVVSAGLKLARVRSNDLPALLVQRVARIRSGTGVDPSYLHIALMSPRFISHLLDHQTGTQLPHITLKGIRTFPLPIPSLDLQHDIVSRFVAVSEQIMAIQRTANDILKRAARLRSSVLTAAFSGQLVTQNPDDETALALLARTTAEQTVPDGYMGRRARTLRKEQATA